jgi:hypothetical protein
VHSERIPSPTIQPQASVQGLPTFGITNRFRSESHDHSHNTSQSLVSPDRSYVFSLMISHSSGVIPVRELCELSLFIF